MENNRKIILSLALLCSFLFVISIASAELVVNLTFDDAGDCGYDDSGRHSFTAQGSADCIVDRTICKWYGCADLTTNGGDYFSDVSNFTLTDDLTIGFWFMPTQSTTIESQAFYELGTDLADDYLYAEEGDYGMSVRWNAALDEVGANAGSSKSSSTNLWSHYVATYNGSHYVLYKNGALIDEQAQSYGNLNYSDGGDFNVGLAIFGIDVIGYMDEFFGYNESLSLSEVLAIYNLQKEGTPPELDLIVVNHTLTDAMNSMYDFSIVNNTLNESGVFNTFYTIKNIGNTSAGAFNTTVRINDSIICKNLTNSLAPFTTVTYECNIPKSVGFMRGVITVDSDHAINESDYDGGNDTNNNQSLYIDFREHPKIIPSMDLAYLKSPGDNPAKDAYDFLVNFVSEDFNPGWTADNVDPRGKKGYENAISCFLSSYSLADNACTRARNHLEGWINTVDDWADGSVQSLHELEWVAKTYDVMFKNLTQAEAESYALNMSQICLSVYGKGNVRPDSDAPTVSAGNGKGFGSGMAYPCSVGLGEYSDNPSNIYPSSDSAFSFSTIDEWYSRIDRHIKGNLELSGFSEGVLYWNYATYHIMGLLWYDSQVSIANISATNQENLCGRSKDAIYYYLDNTYDGNVLRGDLSSNARWITFGDTHSYDEVGEMDITGASMVSGFGLVCEEADITNAMFTVRNVMYDRADRTAYERPLESLYYYKTLEDSATNLTDEQMTSLYYYEVENAWDKYVLRDGYSYKNDTVIFFEGGDKPGFGHPNAEFELVVYALGEPFLDVPQVPFEDDVRTERWHNTISLSNSTAPGYTEDAYDPPLNQPYGGASNPLLSIYPNGDYMPDTRRGILQNYYGLPSLVGGAEMLQPYNGTTEDVTRRILVYDDMILDYFDYTRSSSGYVQFNWLNIYDEFSPTIESDSIEWNRLGTNKNYNLSVLDTDVGLTIEGGNSSVLASSQKTGSANLDVYYGHYRFYNTNTEGGKTIFLHHWYEGSDGTTIAKISSGNDVGVKINSVVDALLDTGNDGVSWGIYNTDGWAIILNSTSIMVNNASWVDNTTHNLTLPYTPYSGNITLGGAPVPPDVNPPQISNLLVTSINTATQRITYDTDEAANATINYGLTTGLGTDENSFGFVTNHEITLSLLTSNTTYFFNITSCDSSENCAINGTYNFTTASASPVPPPVSLIPGLVGFIIALMAVSLMGLIYQTVEGEGFKNSGAIILLTIIVIVVLIGILIISSIL